METKTSRSVGAVALCLAAFSLPTLSGCDAPKPAPAPPAVENNVEKIQSLGNGVFVFPANEQFPKTLSDWRGNHPELRIISVTQGDDKVFHQGFSGAYSEARHMVVVTEPAKKE